MDETITTGGSSTPVADNTATVDPQQNSNADVGEKQKAPETTQEQASQTQETTSPETKVEETAEEKLYAGKFKTPEDMEKAYLSAQSEASRLSQDRAELAKVLDEAFASGTQEPIQPQQRPQQQADDTSNLDDWAGDNQTNNQQQVDSSGDTELEQLKRDGAVNKFLLLHGDADTTTMKEILQTDPLVASIQGYDAKFEYAYQKSKNMSHQRALTEAERAGADKAMAKTAEKQVAQVEDAKKSAPANKSAELVERARAGDASARHELINEIPAVKEMKRMAGFAE